MLDRLWQAPYAPFMSLPHNPESAERNPRAPDMLGLLLDNHARFLSFLEHRVGSRDEAEDIL